MRNPATRTAATSGLSNADCPPQPPASQPPAPLTDAVDWLRRLAGLALFWAALPHLPVVGGGEDPAPSPPPAPSAPPPPAPGRERAAEPGCLVQVARSLLGHPVRIFVAGGTVLRGTVAGLCGRLLVLARLPGPTWIDTRRIRGIATAGRLMAQGRARRFPSTASRALPLPAAGDLPPPAAGDLPPPAAGDGAWSGHGEWSGDGEGSGTTAAGKRRSAWGGDWDDPPPVAADTAAPDRASCGPAPGGYLAPAATTGRLPGTTTAGAPAAAGDRAAAGAAATPPDGPTPPATPASPPPETPAGGRPSRRSRGAARRGRVLYHDRWRLICVVRGRCPCR